jgi:hypothetical protein
LYGFLPNGNSDTVLTYASWNVKSSSFGHVVGRIDGDGWSATVGRDSPNNWMVYGPYHPVSSLPATNCCSAIFELMVDNVTANNDPIAVINVNYVDINSVQRSLISRTIRRGDFASAFQYKSFELDFEKDNLTAIDPVTYTPYFAGKLEFRVLWVGTSYVRVRNEFLKQ